MNSILYASAFALILFLILLVSFLSRSKVFCQYLRFMTGIALKPKEVKRIYRIRGRAGVRELFLDLIIREDIKDSPPVTPDTPPAKPAALLIEDEKGD